MAQLSECMIGIVMYIVSDLHNVCKSLIARAEEQLESRTKAIEISASSHILPKIFGLENLEMNVKVCLAFTLRPAFFLSS